MNRYSVKSSPPNLRPLLSLLHVSKLTGDRNHELNLFLDSAQPFVRSTGFPKMFLLVVIHVQIFRLARSTCDFTSICITGNKMENILLTIIPPTVHTTYLRVISW